MTTENKGKCIIIVPVYKKNLSDDEKASFVQLRNILGEKHDVALVCPKSLDVKEYLDIWTAEKDLSPVIDRYDDKNFASWLSYGKFMTLPEIYKNYRKNYEYMLVYQLDGWVFRDELRVRQLRDELLAELAPRREPVVPAPAPYLDQVLVAARPRDALVQIRVR